MASPDPVTVTFAVPLLTGVSVGDGVGERVVLTLSAGVGLLNADPVFPAPTPVGVGARDGEALPPEGVPDAVPVGEGDPVVPRLSVPEVDCVVVRERWGVEETQVEGVGVPPLLRLAVPEANTDKDTPKVGVGLEVKGTDRVWQTVMVPPPSCVPVEEGEEVAPAAYPPPVVGVPPMMLEGVAFFEPAGEPLSVPPSEPLPAIVMEAKRLPLGFPEGDTVRKGVDDTLAEGVDEGMTEPDPLTVEFPVLELTTEEVGEKVGRPLTVPHLDCVPPTPALKVAPMVSEGESVELIVTSPLKLPVPLPPVGVTEVQGEGLD